jgi:hypothetical protein
MMRQTFGLDAPIRLQMEETLIQMVWFESLFHSQLGIINSCITKQAPQHIPVMKRSNLGLDILQGRDTDIDFEDYLGDVQTPLVSINPHTAMEHSLRL